MTPEEFIAWLAPPARDICGRYRLPASVCIAQGALESAWGAAKIGAYNIFGRKAAAGDEVITATTQEWDGGQWVTMNADFKEYGSLEEAIEDWCRLITEEPVYAPCLDYRDDVEAFVRTLGPIYASDPEYADKILATIHANDLTQYDGGTP